MGSCYDISIERESRCCKMEDEMTPAQAALHLQWLAEMGADEIIGEAAIVRLAAADAATSSPSRGGMAPGFRRDDGPSSAALAATCQTLEDIAAALDGFEACALKKTATRLCLADGNINARVMLVGEAPGRDEDIEGKPFVGRSGQLLDRMLAAIGLSRHSANRETSVFITNTVFWRPPGNRKPTEAETAMCLPFLLRLIEIQQPDFIVCLGATPSQRLTGRGDGILRLRGKWHDYSVGGRNCRLLPTLHPAYLLRQPNLKRLAWRDLLALLQALDS